MVADLNLSKDGVIDYLQSPEGGNFSPEAAEYAANNIKTDFNENAVKAAQKIRDTEGIADPAAIREKLIASKFTPEQVDHALKILG